MSRSALLSTILFFLIALHAGISRAQEPAGSRPMNVAVSPDGQTILATSMGSTSITQAKWNGLDYVLTPIAVGAPSWGIVFVDANKVVVTHPSATKLSILTRPGPGGSFSETDNIDLGAQFRYSTEIIHYPGTNSVLVANRGLPLGGQASWTNAVYLVDLIGEQIAATLLTEREPRALALSPGDGCRLFVGHIQGSLGGDPLALNHPAADNQAGGFIGDGGSILVYDLCPWLQPGPQMPLPGERIGVGSPVRGLAVTENSDGSYVVYFTSVGNNANSEDPDISPTFFGGRQIPNVISALYYNSSNVLQSVERAVFDHRPEWTPDTTFTDLDGLPAVLPDKLVVRDVTIGGQRTRELFIANSGSGTLSRTRLGVDGELLFSGSPVSLKHVLLSRTNNVISIPPEPIVDYQRLEFIANEGASANLSHIDLSHAEQPRFSSNTRAIAYSSSTDKIWVATQLDNELIRVTPQQFNNTVSRFTICDPIAASSQERNFFGFGRGFKFREIESDHPQGEAPTVGNQTCATCHVDAHTDGKVRLTKRQGDNRLNSNSRRKPVAVPTCFDVGQTEWMFFEGLKTIADGDFTEGTDCVYCFSAAFFDSTEAFTDTLSSPRSPHNWQGSLSGSTLRGRHLFEAMNCSRCHMGIPEVFVRTVELDAEATGIVSEGPISTTDRLLHDLTQVFIDTDTGLPADEHSLRNMTDVGTRAEGDGKVLGINTPVLAGVWDSRPYMHDGRYRTLDEVLANTWLQNAQAFRAAPLVEHPTVPDNAFNGDISDMSPREGRALHTFQTHSPGPPSGFTSVQQALLPSDYADLVAFLLSLSSKTDPCSGSAPNFVLNLSFKNGQVKCASPVKIQCRFEWRLDGIGAPVWSETTAWGSSHGSSLPPGADEGFYVVTVTPLVRPICGSPDIEEIEVEIPASSSYTHIGGLPVITEMSPSRPNPFNPTTTIAFSLAKDDQVSIAVFDAAGRLVRSLVDEHRKRDRYSVVWDGTDDRGSPVASGVYFCRMIAGSYRSTQKLVLLK